MDLSSDRKRRSMFAAGPEQVYGATYAQRTDETMLLSEDYMEIESFAKRKHSTNAFNDRSSVAMATYGKKSEALSKSPLSKVTSQTKQDDKLNPTSKPTTPGFGIDAKSFINERSEMFDYFKR